MRKEEQAGGISECEIARVRDCERKLVVSGQWRKGLPPFDLLFNS